MEHLREMVIEDEILMCGAMLLIGIVAGAVGRYLREVWGRRSAGQQ